LNCSILPDAFEDYKKTLKGKEKHNGSMNIHTKKAQDIMVCIKIKLMDKHDRSYGIKIHEYFPFFQ